MPIPQDQNPAAQKPASSPAPDERPPLILLLSACLGMFAATCSGTTRAPFLIDMARDLATSIPVIANLFVVTATAWGFASVLSGMGSDRWGRRPFIVGGPIVLAIAMAGVATAETFLGVALWGAVSGGSAGTFVSALFAEVSIRAGSRQRGRALSWVMSGQSLTLVIGVPLAALIGSQIGWRGANACVAALSLVTAAALFFTTIRPAGTAKPPVFRPDYRAAFSLTVLRLLGMSVIERICYGLTAVYFATFLQSSYGLTLAELALPLAVFASGNILGTGIGGQLADRLRNRLRTFAVAMALSGGAAIVLFGWHPGLVTSVALAFVYVLLNALGRPSLMAALAEVPEQIRGTVMGLNGTSASIGWIGAAALGGWMYAGFGFEGFGPLTAILALGSAALALGRLPVRA